MFHAVNRWRERRKYLRTLKANMSWLLTELPEPMFEKILASYPGIKAAAHTAFEQGTNVNEESVRVVAAVMGDFLLQGLSAATRQQIISSLRSASQEQQPAPEIDSAATLWTNVITTMERQAYFMVQAGKIDSHWRDLLMSEVLGALDGQIADERSQWRVFRALDDALLPKI